MSTTNKSKDASSTDRIEERERTCPIQVVVRCRPFAQSEKTEAKEPYLSFPSNHREVCLLQKSSKLSKTYTFDSVYPAETTQAELYQDTVSHIVEEVLKGFNCTIFAYGQTGTGKTHTMEGGLKCLENMSANATLENLDLEAGIIPRSVHQIFQALEKTAEYSVRVSFLELYNEELIDLLGNSSENLKIFDDHSRKGITVFGLEEVVVTSAADIFKILDRGLKMRQTAETKCNNTSSRSHCIFSVTIHTKESTPDGEDLLKIGKLNLVDLAGSENVGRSGAKDQRKREAGAINQSLLTLGRVITALVERSPHIPYRESKLTRLLQDSLGGKTKTCIIATISPCLSSMEETMSTLDYAFRAKNIRNRPEVNQKMTKKALLNQYVAEIERLTNSLAAQREGKGFYITKEEYEESKSTMQSQKDKLEELEGQLVLMGTSKQELQNLCESQKSELEETLKKLDAKIKEAEQTKKELSTVHELLQETKQEIVKKEVEIKEKESAHTTLWNHTSQIYNTATDAISATDGLHKKIERKSEVEEANEKLSSNFQQEFTLVVKNAESKVDQFKEKQSQSFEELSKTIQQFMVAKESEISRLKSQVSELQSVLQENRQLLVDITLHHQQNQHSRLQNYSSEQEQYQEQLNARVGGFLTESSQIIHKIQSQLNVQNQEIIQWTEKTQEDVHTHLESSKQFVADRTVELDTIQTSVSQSASSQSSCVQKTNAALSSLVDQQREQSKKFQEQIMALLQSHIVSQEQQLSLAVSEMQSSLQSSVVNADQLASSVARQTESSKKHLGEFLENQEAVSQKSMEALKSVVLTTTRNKDVINDNLSSLITTQSSFEENSKKFAAEFVDKTKQMIDTEINQVDQYTSAHQEHVDNLSSKQSDLESFLKEQLTTSHQSTCDVMTGLQESIQHTNQNSVQFQEHIKEDIQEARGRVAQFLKSQKKDIPTGATPAKKQRSLPSLFVPPTASPQESIEAYIKHSRVAPLQLEPTGDDEVIEYQSPKIAHVVNTNDNISPISAPTIASDKVTVRSSKTVNAKQLQPPSSGKFARKDYANKENSINS